MAVSTANSDSTMRLTIQEARELGARALRKLGFPEGEIDIILDHLLGRGRSQPDYGNLPRILEIADRMKKKEQQREISVVHETEISAVVDGGNKVGYVVVHRAAQIAIEKAKKKGFAVVGAYNSYYSGRNAYYLEMITKANLVGIHAASSHAQVAPLGGKRPALGTNPIAFGFPSSRGPVIFDMGTSAIMAGNVQMRARLGEELPEGVCIDADGRPTRDAKEALLGAILPFGGHKGYGLAFTVQAFGLLAGAAATRGQVQDFGFFFIAFDPGLLMPVEEFKRQLSELVDRIKSTPRQNGVQEILVPYERTLRNRERDRGAEGILVKRGVYDALNAL